jgi:hypothetical protein
VEDRAAEKSATGQDLKSTVGHAGDIPVDISRGPAGDCCIYCGRVAVDLPVDHACRPNLSQEDLAELEADRRRPHRSWADILDGAR